MLEAEAGVMAYAAELHFEVLGAPQGDPLVSRTREVLRAPLVWPVQVTIAPEGGDARRRFRIDVTALDASAQPIGVVRASSRFVEGRVLELRLRFEDCCYLLAAGCTSNPPRTETTS